jgi:hypothetical protein
MGLFVLYIVECLVERAQLLLSMREQLLIFSDGSLAWVRPASQTSHLLASDGGGRRQQRCISEHTLLETI